MTNHIAFSRCSRRMNQMFLTKLYQDDAMPDVEPDYLCFSRMRMFFQ